jgi:sugar phosphate isomerase/epimerase
MKYAFMTFSTPDLELPEVLALARRLGYDGVEVRIDAKHRHGLERGSGAAGREAARKTAAEAGVELCCVATSCRFADPAAAEKAVAEAREAIDLAADIGARRVRVFGGQIPAGTGREAAVEGVASALSSLAGQAGERGVTVCLETHDDWCDPKHVAAVLDRVGDPAIAANWDIMHPVRTGKATMDEAFAALGPRVRHVHFHDGAQDNAQRMVPVGEGQIDHRRAVQLLAGAGYDGFLSGEWINWQPAEEHLPRELATMKRYEREAAG